MYKILLVDDEEWIRESTKNKLEMGGFDPSCIREASDGNEALQIIEKEPQDIVICDIRMEEMDGLELCKVLSQRYPAIGKIIVSGYSEFDYATKVMHEGVTSYLLKPIDGYELLNAVKDCIQKIENAKKSSDIQAGIREKIYDISESYQYYLSNPSRIKQMMKAYNESFGAFACCHVYMGMDNCVTAGEAIALMLSSASGFTFGEDFFIIKCETLEYSMLFWQPGNEELSETESRPRAIAQRLHEAFRQKEVYGTSIGVAASERDPLRCIAAARFVMKHRVLLPEAAVLTQEMTKQFSGAYHPQHQLVARYRYAMESGNYREVCEVLKVMQDEVIATIPSLKGLSAFYRMLTEQIVNNEELPNGWDADQEERIKPLWRYHDIRDMFNGVRDMCLSKINKTFLGNGDMRKVIAHRVKDYIDSNYYREISLEKLAEDYYISPAYLSLIFKETIGINFLDYLLKIRIRNAKELLSLKKYKIKIVAEMSGFNDQHYFSRVFKKAAGLTPKEYVDSI